MRFGFDCVKPKYDENAKPCYMDTDSSIIRVKIDGSYKGIAEDVKTRFGNSNFEWNRPSPKGKNKKTNWINERTSQLVCHKNKT